MWGAARAIGCAQPTLHNVARYSRAVLQLRARVDDDATSQVEPHESERSHLVVGGAALD